MNESLSSVVLSRANLLHNLSVFKDIVGPNRKISAVVKANAYGHGLKEVVTVLDDVVDYFQVDDIEELRTVRTVTDKPCLVLGYVAKEFLAEAVSLNGTLGIFDIAQLERLNTIGREEDKVVTVHVEIDAFLGRLGILAEDVEEFLRNTQRFSHIAIEAIYGHFSDIEDTNNLEHAEEQFEVVRAIAEKRHLPYHIAATSGILSGIDHWQGSIVRLGVGLYGIWPSKRLQEQWQDKISLEPVLQWQTRVAQVKTLPSGYPVGYGQSYITTRETKIAVIPQGYSDGYDRLFSNNSAVLIKGMRCPVIGRVAMNMFVVDVTPLSDIAVEEEVVLLGTQGEDRLTADEMAERIGTISYEIIARISPLLERKIR